MAIYSVDGEIFNYNDWYDAADDVFNDPDVKVGDIRNIYSGEPDPFLASHFLNTYSVIIDMSERAYEEFHDEEVTDDWPKVSQDQEKELVDMLENTVNLWASKHNLHPSFFGIKNVKELKVRFCGEDAEETYQLV